MTSYVTAAEFSEKMPDASYLLSDEPEMESSLHYLQLLLLFSTLDWFWRDRGDYFIGANLTIYYSREQLRNREFRGPDFFLVKEVSPRLRPSWVVWEEDGKYPNLIIELLSDSTARVDRTLKKQLYQDRFRTPEYFWFSPDTLEFEGFRLLGHEYQPIAIDSRGWRWSEELDLYLGVESGQLRYFLPNGEKVLTPQEAALQEQAIAEAAQQQADMARQQAVAAQQQAELAQQDIALAQQQAELAQQQAESERQRADRLAQRLKAMGINPDAD